METLKTILADKIIDISSGGGDDIHSKLDKVSRFRDFTGALESLMVKYPQIETELIRMVKNNDFDTKLASSRVDAIIRLSENDSPVDTNKDISQLDEIIRQEENEIIDVPVSEDSEYTDFEVVEPETDEAPIINQYERVVTTNNNVNKENLKKGIQVAGIVIAIILFIFVVVFVINNWKAILYILGATLIVALVGWLLYKKFKK